MSLDLAPPAQMQGSRRRRMSWAPVIGFLARLPAWWGATHPAVVSDPVVQAVAPQHALPAIEGLLARGVLVADAASSLYRLLSGLLVATVIGVPVGLLVGLSP